MATDAESVLNGMRFRSIHPLVGCLRGIHHQSAGHGSSARLRSPVHNRIQSGCNGKAHCHSSTHCHWNSDIMRDTALLQRLTHHACRADARSDHEHRAHDQIHRSYNATIHQ
jgi:hypothetical protein